MNILNAVNPYEPYCWPVILESTTFEYVDKYMITVKKIFGDETDEGTEEDTTLHL